MTDALVASGKRSTRESRRDDVRSRVLAYYTAATPDYRAWSQHLNMHFGYWRWPLNPLDREDMLDELNRQVVRRLDLPLGCNARVADLGGGMGATARVIVAERPDVTVDVVTLIPRQVEIARRTNAHAVRAEAITMHCEDYTRTRLPAASFDGVCIVEAACHAEGRTKRDLLREARRLLKPGGVLVIVDAMLKRPVSRTGLLGRAFSRIYDEWCECWAVPEMCRVDLLRSELSESGFSEPQVEDWSWRIFPSVAHVPLFASWFAVKALVAGRGRLATWRWRHIVASLLTPLLGLKRSTVAYVAVSARKRG